MVAAKVGSVGRRVAAAVTLIVLCAVGWSMTAASASTDTELQISLSTEGSCAPIGQDTIYINGPTVVTMCHHMVNNSGQKVSDHVLDNSEAGILLNGLASTLNPGASFTEQADHLFSNTTLFPTSWLVTASWTAESTTDVYLATAEANVFECPTDVFVDESAAPDGDGLSWASAFTDLQDGLDVAAMCKTVTDVSVAGGTYLPDRGTGDVTMPFVLPDGVTVTGGFAPGGSQNPTGATTTLSGDLAGNDSIASSVNELDRFDNAATVVALENEASASLIGVTVSNGGNPISASDGVIRTGSSPVGGLVLRDLVVEDNVSFGAIVSHTPDLAVVSSFFQVNLTDAAPLIQGTTADGASTQIVSTIFSFNTTPRGVQIANGEVINSIFSNHSSGTGVFVNQGGAIDVVAPASNRSVAITNVTMFDNVFNGVDLAPPWGAIRVAGDATQPVSITNSILWDNFPSDVHVDAGGSQPTITHSVMAGATGATNSSSDPILIDAIPQLGSPAIDLGDSSALPADEFDLDGDGDVAEAFPIDLLNQPRIAGSSVDAGVVEFPLVCPAGPAVFVDDTAAGADSGTSWTDAFDDLQDGLGLAAACATVSEVRVAAGTYFADRGTFDRDMPFVLPDGVTVRGGYADGGSPEPTGALSTLSGDLQENDSGPLSSTNSTLSDNTTTIVQLAKDASATIEGFSITKSSTQGTVAATVDTDTSPSGQLTMIDVVAEGNYSRNVIRHTPDLILLTSVVQDNVVADTTLSGTSADGRSTSIIGTKFLRNQALAASGALISNGIVVNSAFVDGSSQIEAESGGLFIDGPATNRSVLVSNSTVAGNASLGDIVLSASASQPVMIQNTVIGDPVFGFAGSSVPSFVNSINGSVPLLFVDAAAGDYRLQAGSPAVDAGDNALLALDDFDLDDDGDTAEALPFDVDGVDRTVNGIVDIGAFERQADGLTIFADPTVCFDSRFGGGGTFDGGEVRTVAVAGVGECVPEGASSVIFTVSSIDPLTEGNLRMTPAGVVATGGAGVVNYGANNGLNNTNTVTVPLSEDGEVDIQANAGPAGAVPTTDVRLLAVGYYSPNVTSPTKFFPLNPCAVADTRTNKGADDAHDGPNDDGYWPVGGTFPDIDVAGTFPSGQGGGNTDCGVPNGVDAVLVNVVTIAPRNAPGFISAGPGGSNPGPEAVTSFAPLTPVVAGGFNNGATTVLPLNGGETIALDIDGFDPSAETRIRVEVLGYYGTDPDGLDFTPVPPCAVFDSRPNKGGAGSFGGERAHGPTETTTYQISGDEIPAFQGGIVPFPGSTEGTCNVPDGASAVLINLEAVNALQEGNLWVAAATATPGAATTGGVLNFNNVTPKMNNANTVVVPLSAAGQLDVEVNAGSFTADGTAITQVRGVILGYYS